MNFHKLKRKDIPIISNVNVDKFTDIASKCFDYEFNGISEVFPFEFPNELRDNFNIGVIVGSSGSGKSTLLREFGFEENLNYNNQSVISNFEEPEEAIYKLCSVGLSSVPTWVKPYSVLSNGEKFRVDLARRIKDNAVIDEFTSVVDRDVAISSSVSVSKYIKENNIKNVVFATCHRDILDYIEPCWVIDTDMGVWYYSKECLRKPRIKINIYESNYKSWEFFKKHHYLAESINKASKCYVAEWNGVPVGFISIITSPNGYVKNAWRIHRLVVLPEFQGMGFGKSILNTICEMYVLNGCRVFLKTAHVKLGKYCDKSNNWISTTHNKKKRTENEKMLARNWHGYQLDTSRECYTYEYVNKDFYEREHIRIGIKIKENTTYKEFENFMDIFLQDYIEKYIIFVSSEIGIDNHADTYGKMYSIRREFLGTKSKYDIFLEI